MTDVLKQLENDADGMATYDYIVNNTAACLPYMHDLIINMKRCDVSGQFLASTARYLAAVDRQAFAEFLPALVDAAIDKDRERRYIGSLLEALWGADYAERAEELRETDDSFRRVYKRIFQKSL